jgi:hypothetical protein
LGTAKRPSTFLVGRAIQPHGLLFCAEGSHLSKTGLLFRIVHGEMRPILSVIVNFVMKHDVGNLNIFSFFDIIRQMPQQGGNIILSFTLR